MVDENGDRVPAPGQHGVPERDIEPLWPPDQIDSFAAPTWGAPPPAPPAVPPTPNHPATGQPAAGPAASATGHPGVPPSPADYPSLTGGGPASTGWEPSPAGRQPQAAQVDLDQPFILDQPTSLTASRGGTPAEAAPSPATADAGSSFATSDAGPPHATTNVGPSSATTNAGPFAAGPDGDHGPAVTPDTGGATSGPADSGPTDSGAELSDQGGSMPPAPRPQAESPWAQPPQRSAPEVAAPIAAQAGEAAQASARPTWAAPAQPLPPVSQPTPVPSLSQPMPGPSVPQPMPGPSVPQPMPGPSLPQQAGPPGLQQAGSHYAVTPPPAAPLHGTAPVPYQEGFTGSASVPVTPQPANPVPPPTEIGPPAPPYAGPMAASPAPYPAAPSEPPYPAAPSEPPYPAASPEPPYPAAASEPYPAAPSEPYPAAASEPYAAAPPGPFPPQPAWNPAPWQQQGAPPPVAHPLPHRPYQPAETASRVPSAYPEQDWNPDQGSAPTAEDFARRRQVRPVDPVATMGVRAVVNKTGLVKLPPGRHELELKRDIEMVRRNFGGLRQVTVVNPKGGAGKTVAILLLAMTFGQKRGGYVLAWDNNETQGTLGMRAQQDFHSRTVRDLLRDLGQFHGAHGRVGDLSQYVRSQGEGMFDVLASDESATGGEMLTAAAFGEIREVVSRFYKLIFVDTGNNVRAQNWQAAMDATDQLLVTMSARNDSAETAARMLDHLEQSGRQRLVRQAVTVVSMPPSRKEIDLPAIQEHFAARTRAVLLAPYERLIDTGEPIRYAQLSSATRDAWLKIAAAVAEGL
ncbi:chromosome partitioning protein [Micromonospora sp. FIMYZ51]|uniref:MinD/ParA family ATP-binding protein n=1 Tax=Micromonospora sp. FIMYZ51 TaxID=3051832 RepID=UPI00311EBA55